MLAGTSMPETVPDESMADMAEVKGVEVVGLKTCPLPIFASILSVDYLPASLPVDFR